MIGGVKRAPIYTTIPQCKRMSGAGGGFAGTTGGSFFNAPGWVDLKKPPGTTPQVPTPWASWAKGFVTLKSLIYSPNLVWLTAAVLNYVFFPYDLTIAKTWGLDWVGKRAAVNFLFVFAYYGFWYGTLYIADWSLRKFRAETRPSWTNLSHNIFYSSLGTLQYTGWEVLFLHLYATGKLSYVSDAEVISSPKQMLTFFAWVIFVPFWRGIHFYFAHRLIHIRVLYKYVHSLHHRNTDIEPFAGMSMHPVEHLYYFSCMAPSLYFATSPFIMAWNGMHLILSPAASHSGWEDHMQSDQFHYIHHAKFECNYGSASFPLDHWFGTFRDRMVGMGTYKGAGQEDEVKEKTKPSPFKMNTPPGFNVYLLFTAVIFAVAVSALVGQPTTEMPRSVAALLAFGPIGFGVVLRQVLGDTQPLSWPFHKEKFFGGLHQSFAFNLLIGVAVAVVPVYHILEAALTTCSVCA